MRTIDRSLWILVICAAAIVSASAQPAADRAVAARFAPVLYQALGDKPRSDYITNFDFDGDWRGDNNWENADNKKFPLRAYVYYAVSETQTHYFIHYAIFHPRDYKGGSTKGLILSNILREGLTAAGDRDPTGLAATATVAHENDMEGALVVVEKNGNDPSRHRVAFVETVFHNKFPAYVPVESSFDGFSRFRTEDQRTLLYIEPKGHGIEAYDPEKHGEKRMLAYKFTGKAEDPEKRKEGPIGYDLVPIATTLWPRAAGGKTEKPVTFGSKHDYGEVSISVQTAKGVAAKKIKLGSLGSAFFGDSGGLNMARPPWGWFDSSRREDPLGLWFFDPARIIKRDFKLPDSFSTTYIDTPFWAEK